MSEQKNVQPNKVSAERQAEKMKSLETAIQSIEKQFGKGAVMRLGDSNHLQVEVISTGSLSLDIAIGVGGLPRGRIVEIFGPESSGKTTLALHALAEAQRTGGQVAFIDVEHAFDPAYARVLGLDTDNLLIAQPSGGEEALEIAEMLVRSNAIEAVVVDSVAALSSKAEIEGDMGDTTVGMQARLMSQAMRKLTPVVSRSRCICIFINQIREKIGVMFGNPETTPGGRALKFFASIRLDIRRKETIKEGDAQVGYMAEIKVVKNKVSPPFKRANFDIMFGRGISKEGEILDLAEKSGIVAKSGAWYSYGDTRMGQGRENSKEFLVNNPDILSEIVLKVKTKFGLVKGEQAASKPSPEQEKTRAAGKSK